RPRLKRGNGSACSIQRTENAPCKHSSRKCVVENVAVVEGVLDDEFTETVTSANADTGQQTKNCAVRHIIVLVAHHPQQRKNKAPCLRINEVFPRCSCVWNLKCVHLCRD